MSYYDALQLHLPRNFGIHGYPHWERVVQNGLTMARVNGADEIVVELFGWLHDSRRLNDHHDPEHGERAAALVRQLNGFMFNLTDSQLEMLVYALELHDKGGTDSNVTIGTCWDADRLDLPRVGKTPTPRLMSTEIGRMLALIHHKREIHEHLAKRW